MCHHPGGSAPFSLLTYADAKRRAAQIATVTAESLHAAVESGSGRRSVRRPASAERRRDRACCGGGRTRGAPRRRSQPASRQSVAVVSLSGPTGWQLGKPDLVVTLPQPYTLPAEGTDVFRIFVLPIPVETARFVRGLEFRPGNPKVVHHANIRIDTTPASRRLDEADPGPGYDGLIARSATYPDGHFLGWTPGQVAPLLPNDLAWRLEPNTDLVVELHMQPSGKAGAGCAVDRPLLRRRGADADAGDAAARAAGHRHPCRRRALHVTDSYVLPVDVEVEAVQPHAHYRARDVRGEATLPDGSTKRAHRHRRLGLPLAARLPLRDAAAGCRRARPLSMRYTYDNSADERAQPAAAAGARALGTAIGRRDGRPLDPGADARRPTISIAQPRLPAEGRRRGRQRLRGGDREAPRRRRRCTTMWRCCIWSLGKNDEAIAHFKTSLALKPQSAPAHYNLGTALTVARRLDEAAAEYREALQIDPAYANAHNNLGNVLLSQKRFDEAIREFEEVVRLQPDSAAARKNLAAAYAARMGARRRADESLQRIRRASSPSSVTSSSKDDRREREEDDERVAHHVARAEPEQPEDRQHPERLHQVGERLAEIVRRDDPARGAPSACAPPPSRTAPRSPTSIRPTARTRRAPPNTPRRAAETSPASRC